MRGRTELSLERFASARESFARFDERLPAESEYPFLDREFFGALEECSAACPETGWEPQHAVFLRGDEPVAFVPIYLKSHSFGEFVFDQAIAAHAEQTLGISYYPKLLIAVPLTPATGPKVLFARAVAEHEKDELTLQIARQLAQLGSDAGLSSAHALFLPPREAQIFEQAGFVLRDGRQFHFRRDSMTSFEDYLARFRAKRRAAIRRERRELFGRGDIQLERVTGTQLRALSTRLVYELYLTTVDKHVWGRRYLTEEFFGRILDRLGQRISIVIAREKGTQGTDGVKAMAFNLVGQHGLYGRYWGTFEEVPFLHFEACLYQGIEDTLARGLPVFEPGAGGEHKEARGFHPTRTQSAHLFYDSRLHKAVARAYERERADLDASDAESSNQA